MSAWMGGAKAKSELELVPEYGVKNGELKDLPERNIVAWFQGRMKHKFQLKREKEEARQGTASWEAAWADYLQGKSSVDYLLRRMLEEVGELAEALKVHDKMPTPENRYAVIDEAADIANFAALIAYKYRSYPYHPEYAAAEDASREGYIA